MSDESIPDVPVGLFNHVCEEDGLDLVHEEDLSHRLQYLINRVAEGYVAAAGHRSENRDNRSYLASGVIVVGDTVLGRYVGVVLLFFVHFILPWFVIIKLRTSYIATNQWVNY